MKRISILFIISFLFILSCEDEKKEESLPYKDLSVIYLGSEKYNCLDRFSNSFCDQYPGVHREWDCFYRGTEPTINNSDSYNWFMSSLSQKNDQSSNDVDWVSRVLNKVKYIHYFVNDNYIEYEVIGEDELESLDLDGYWIIDYVEN